MQRALPIGLFDSGVGGLTVFRALAQILPRENLLYLGDTARVPYGTRSRETIARYTLMAAAKLAERGVKMLIVACNTATASALPEVAAHFSPLPVLGVVEPGAAAAAAATRNGHIAVTGTEATINGSAYQRAIAGLMPAARVTARACPLLVPLAEEGWLDGEATRAVLRRYLADIFEAGADKPDTLLLGCTHFPLFTPVLRELAGPDVAIVDSAQATALAARARLEQLDLQNAFAGSPERHFLTTDNVARFARTGSLFLGRPLRAEAVELVDL